VASELWHEVSGSDRAKCIVGTIDSFSSEQEQRRKRTLKNLSLYEGKPLAELNPRSYYTADNYMCADGAPYRVNLARALVSTATAKIAAKQRPKAAFAATEADWSIKRKAKKKERFVEAAMMARQGQHHDAYSVGLMMFRDCCIADVGVLKFWADKDSRRVAIDGVLPWEYMVDPNEVRRGMALNHFHDYGYDRFKLLHRFKDVPGAEEAIMTAPAISDNYIGGFGRGGVRDKARLVRVSEAWRLALSDEKPGAHAMICGDIDLAQGEKWTRQFPPFETMVWEPWFMGAFGTSLVEVAAPICEELNAAFERWAAAERLGSNMIGFYRKGTINPADLESNDTVVWIGIDPGIDYPVLNTPQTMGEASIQWMNVLERLGYEIPGISKSDATAQKPSGVTADIAIRTVNALGAERFAVQWQQYERVMAIGATRQILACVKELEEDGKGVLMRFPAGGVLQELNSKDFNDYDVPDEAIQVQVVSGLVNTVADRLDLGEKLYTMGIITKESFKRVVQYKDIDGELSSESEQSTLLAKYIEKWLDAEEPVKGKKDQPKKPYSMPVSFKWMNLEEAIVQVGRAAMQAELDECPDYNMKFFLDFLKLCDKELSNRAAAQSSLAQTAGGGAGGLAAVNAGGAAPGTVASGPVGVPMQGAA
jgi:hypothetical protein